MEGLVSHISLLVDVYETMPVEQSVMHQIEEYCARQEVADVVYSLYQ